MRYFKIIISRKNIYTEQVKKLKNELYIEDLLNESTTFNFDNSIVYFLCCNSPFVFSIINKLKQYNCYIINKQYLSKNYLKLDVQKILYKSNINIPKIYDGNIVKNLENINFPIFCKENRHEGMIMQVYNPITVTRLFKKVDIKDFYFEEAIESINSKELKVYYVKGKLFFKNIKDYNKLLEKLCNQISTILDNLEVFSVDIIQMSNDNYFVIDVNPAAGFYLSDSGRKYFLNNLEKK